MGSVEAHHQHMPQRQFNSPWLMTCRTTNSYPLTEVLSPQLLLHNRDFVAVLVVFASSLAAKLDSRFTKKQILCKRQAVIHITESFNNNVEFLTIFSRRIMPTSNRIFLTMLVITPSLRWRIWDLTTWQDTRMELSHCELNYLPNHIRSIWSWVTWLTVMWLTCTDGQRPSTPPTHSAAIILLVLDPSLANKRHI